MINISEIKCVGCTACASVCPQKIIKMERNNEGFQYPVIQSVSDCIECKLCEKVCPVLNFKQEISCEQVALITQIKDEKIRQESTSGGMFSAIALSVLNENGIVYGVAYTENFEVCHVEISNKDDLWRLRNSKYVQSNLVGVFNNVKQHLDSGKKVCFSGSPCQIEGLQGFLRKDYPNLILVDVVCHGVSSPLIWEKYLETIKDHNTSRIYFRWKHYGYKYSTMSFFNKKNDEIYYAGVESDRMLKAYFSNSCDRDTCYECLFKKRYRTSDFTIWDCFQPKFFNKEFDDDMGTTAVLVHSEKGKNQLKKIIESNLIKYQYLSPEELVLGNNEMVSSVKKCSFREELLADASHMTGEQLFNKYFPNDFKSKVKKTFRILLVRIGLYNTLKYLLFIRRRNRFRK